MKERFRKYLDKKLFVYFKSQQLDDYKEELLDGMMDRYHSYIEAGDNPETAYGKTIDHFGDITSGVPSLTEVDLTTKEKAKRVGRYLFGTALYWVTITTIFLMISLIGKANGANLWGAAAKYSFPFAGLLFAAIALFGSWQVAKIYNKRQLKRLAISGFIMVIATALYLLLSFILDDNDVTVAGVSIWAFNAIIFGLGLIAVIIVDRVFNKGEKKPLSKKKKKVLAIVGGILGFIGLYLLLSFLIKGAWAYTWIMFLFAVIGLLAFGFVKMNKKNYRTTTAEEEKAEYDKYLEKKGATASTDTTESIDVQVFGEDKKD